MSVNSLLAIFLARKWVILLTTGLAVFLALAVVLMRPKSFTAATELIVDGRGLDPISGQTQPARLMVGYVATQADIIRSRTVANKVIEEIGEHTLVTASGVTVTVEDKEIIRRKLYTYLGQGLQVVPKRDSNVIGIGFEAKDPVLAANLANAFAQAYIFTNLEMRIEPARQTSEWYKAQLASLRTELTDRQNKLSAYREEHQIIATPDRLDLESARLAELSTQLMAAQTERLNSQNRRDQINSTQKIDPESRAMDNPQVQQLAAELAKAESTLRDLGQQVGENHPHYLHARGEVAQLKQQLKRLLELISGSLRSSVELSKAREEQLKNELATQKEWVLQLSRHKNELALLQQEVDNAQAAYDSALARSAQTHLESQISTTDIAVLNPAISPGSPTPSKLVITLILALVGGVLGGAAIALAWEWLDQRIRTNADIESDLGLPLLTCIPPGVSEARS